MLNFMYTDAENYVTTGMGDLADPVSLALAMPWKNPDGSLADSGSVTDQWTAVKNGGVNSSVNAGPLSTIRLDPSDIQVLVNAKLTANETQLKTYFPNWESFPADGQMAILSMAWAMGAGFPATFPAFTAAVNNNDWTTAAANANFTGVGVAPRIAANAILFANAALVVANHLDPTLLYYPNTASGSLEVAGIAGQAVLPILGLAAGAVVFVPSVRAWALKAGRAIVWAFTS
jgi:hypothetical protein